MWLMMKAEAPDDLVVATGKHHSVRDFVEIAARHVNIDVTWSGQGIDEIGYDDRGKPIVKVDPRYFRPSEVDELLGDPSKVFEQLGWTPKISFEDLVSEMMAADIKLAREEKSLRDLRD
jgi:GDPmannose 4,6-dehydratase